MQHTVAIEREEVNGVHQFVLRIDGERQGFLEFTRPEVGVLHIDYVEVSPELRGPRFRLAARRKGRRLRQGCQPEGGAARSDARRVIQREALL